MFIKSIHIKNFRSIVNSKVDFNDIVVLSGNNDVGKSNYLKALNLFFNNQTDFNTSFDFERDFCKFAKVSKKMAKEISIIVEFISPSSYKEKENIFWQKIWRTEGEIKSKSIKTYENKKEVKSSRSRTNHWIEHLKFRYVPAIKSDLYFQELLGDLNDTLAESVEKEIQIAATVFTQKIQESTNEISEELSDRLQLDSTLILPHDLRKIFQTLDFNTKFIDINLPLKNRGDGIKTRHIPVILKFLAEQDNKTRTQGAPKIDTIWGFEEPENNLELKKAFDLSRDFYDYSSNIQIIITTHSSAFYSLKKLDRVFPEIKYFDFNKITTYYIAKDEKNNYSSIINNANLNDDEIDEKMGLMPLVTPYIIEKIKENKYLTEQIDQLNRLHLDSTVPVILTEGKSDPIILKKAWEMLYPNKKMPFKIRSCDTTPNEQSESAGATILKHALNSLSPDRPKTIGLFDYDEKGINEYKSLSKSFIENGDKKIHKNKKCAALCIPKINNRIDYYNANNLPIEFVFNDEYIIRKCPKGIGLGLKQEKCTTRIGNKLLKEVDSTESFFRKIINNKVYFAKEIVPTFPNEAFSNFSVIFDEISKLFDMLID